MARGEWSFIHESVIYQYLIERANTKNLKLKQVWYNGKFIDKKVEVVNVDDITNTRFPDVDSISIKSDKKGNRPAEVKFLTSQFNYHNDKKYKKEYSKFIKDNGFILVYKHDIIPSKLNIDEVDIYELIQEDFVNFVKENFERLFYQQVKEKKDRNVWISYCGRDSNFKNGYEKGNMKIKPAIESNIWCPTKNISPNEMTVGDKVLFIKTKGIGQKELQRDYKERVTDWYLDEVHICEVRTPIMSREEYCRRRNIQSDKFLWASEAKQNKTNYNFVFEFFIERSYEDLNISLQELREVMPDIVDLKIKEVFLRSRDKQINIDEYIKLLEYISDCNYLKLKSYKKIVPNSTGTSEYKGRYIHYS